MSKDFLATTPTPKRARKTLNKKETKQLSEYFKSVDDEVLMFEARNKLLERSFPNATNDYIHCHCHRVTEIQCYFESAYS